MSGRWAVRWSSLRSLRASDIKEIAAIAALAVRVDRELKRGRNVVDLAAALGVRIDRADGPSSPLTGRMPGWARRRVSLTNAVMRRLPVRDTCLTRSLVLAVRLRALEPNLRIGVARLDGQVNAHAWLEFDGQYFDPGAATFVPLLSVDR